MSDKFFYGPDKHGTGESENYFALACFTVWSWIRGRMSLRVSPAPFYGSNNGATTIAHCCGEMLKSVNVVGSISRKAGGLQQSVRGLVSAVVAAGAEAEVVTLRDAFTEQDLPLLYPHVVRVGCRFGPEVFGVGCLQPLIRTARPEILHLHGLWQYSSFACTAYARKHGVPLVVSPHGMLNAYALWDGYWRKRLARLLYQDRHLRSAACLRALSIAEARSFRKCGLTNPIAVVPNGVNDSDPEWTDSPPPWKGHISAARKVILYIGRIYPKKGLLDLVRAWAFALESSEVVKEWVLIIAGWDQEEHEAALKSEATALKLRFWDIRDGPRNYGADPNVVFAGPIFGKAKAAAWQHSDAFVLPSHGEALSMAILEAWERGIPALITPECSLDEAVGQGAAWGIQRPAERMAIQLAHFMRLTAAERSAIGTAGRRLVKEGFTWSRVGAQMVSVYSWLLGVAPKPPWVFR